MRNDESDWRRERRRNRIFIGVAAVATVAGLDAERRQRNMAE